MRHLIVASALLVLGCDPMAARDPSSAAGESAEAKREDAKGDDEDEVAEDRAIMADHSLDARFREVKVMQNDQLGCALEVLGLVDVHMPMRNEDEALEVLRRKAAKLQASTVINVEFHHGEPGDEPTHLSGMAARCNDLVKGRTYETVAQLDVVAEMGKEDDGFAELRRRARVLGADLLLGVTFEHGDGEGKPTHVRGTAVRFTSPTASASAVARTAHR